MGKLIAEAEKEVLAQIVRLAQKQGLRGAKGGWKEFLKSEDKKLGDSLSDPARRSRDILLTFLESFTEEEQKIFDKMIRRLSNQNAIRQFFKESPELESPRKRLLRMTMEHPQYPLQYSFQINEEWVVTRLGKMSKAMMLGVMVSIDCEMVLCQDGTEAVVKVCVVDNNLEVKLDQFVNPYKPVADYRTHITGISSKDLEGVTCSLADIQRSLKKILSHGTILIGHSLYNDLQVLKLDHQLIIDTSYIFNYCDLPTGSPSLNNLCKAVLGVPVREEGEPHNCLNDARAPMKLVIAKLEMGFDDPIAVAGNKTLADPAKLFLHKVPVDAPCKELIKIFPQNTNISMEADLRIRGKSYSTFAIFRTAGEADKAFMTIEGREEKDSRGLSQKYVNLKLSTGKRINLYVRRMTTDSYVNKFEAATSRKRPPPEEETGDVDSKRQRTWLHQCDHCKETEELKKEVQKLKDEVAHLKKKLDDNGMCH